MTWVVEEDLALKEFMERREDGFKRRKLNLYDTHGAKGKGNILHWENQDQERKILSVDVNRFC
jgi:hypothetical protein